MSDTFPRLSMLLTVVLLFVYLFTNILERCSVASYAKEVKNSLFWLCCMHYDDNDDDDDDDDDDVQWFNVHLKAD